MHAFFTGSVPCVQVSNTVSCDYVYRIIACCIESINICHDYYNNIYILTDIDECALSLDNCSPFAICINQDGGFNCSCLPGYEGHGVTCNGTYMCILCLFTGNKFIMYVVGENVIFNFATEIYLHTTIILILSLAVQY